jgi:hypothetical protein
MQLPTYIGSLSERSNLRIVCAKVRRSSAHARLHVSVERLSPQASVASTYLMPKHMRGPREKATSQLSSSFDSSQRSGLNAFGSGKRVPL